MKYIKWFKDLGKEDVGVAGGKGANLGELTQANIPVPPGFVILSAAYFDFLDFNKLRGQIHQILATCDVTGPNQLNTASRKIKKLLGQADIPHDLAMEIMTSYHKLGSKTAVAVRSSAAAEDLPEASFAGQQDSFLNIVGDANVVEKVRQCWMSLFGARSIFYRQQKHFDHFKVGIAVPVQKMVQPQVSGVMFTADPISRDRDKIVIEAALGLGDYIVQGVVTPDHYEVSRAGQILVKTIAKQQIMEVRSQTGVKQVKVRTGLTDKQKLPDEVIIKLAEIGKKIHHHYFFPQDTEWAWEKGRIYITQSRPITTLGEGEQSSVSGVQSDNRSPSTEHLSLLLTGAPASPGLVTGPVQIVVDVRKLDQVKKGDVMVTDMTTPDFVPAMKRAAAIVTNRGGLTSHAAIVSRELGVPCVVGTNTATKVLSPGMIVTINDTTGEVFQGSLKLSPVDVVVPKVAAKTSAALKTATHVHVNLAEPDLADEMAQRHVDGVGLLRAEFMIAGIGTHPKKLIAEKKEAQFVDKLAAGLAKFCKAFGQRPVIYRATDFKTNEYRSLKGGDRYEPEEANPMLGFRGAYRYVKTPEVFNLELDAIKKVRHKMGHKNLWLMIPFVSTVNELIEVKKLVAATGLYRSGSFKLFMMVEIPANVILLDDFINVGIDGVSIGSNGLTMLILGIDRDNQEVAPNFDERNPAVLWAVEKTVKTAIKHKIMCGICGQAPSQYPELVEKLVDWGITSISVNPDAIDRTRDIIYHCESKKVTAHGQA